MTFADLFTRLPHPPHSAAAVHEATGLDALNPVCLTGIGEVVTQNVLVRSSLLEDRQPLLRRTRGSFEKMTAKAGRSAKLSAWQRYALFVFAVGVGYTCVAAFLYRERWSGTQHLAPSLQRAAPSTGPVRSPARGSPSPWVETVSGTSVDEPRVFIIHNLLSDTECEHLIALALKRGLKASLITPYGSHDLVESTTRTNKQAWLEFGEDAIVKNVEERIGRVTKTYPEQGENLQVPHAT